LWWAIAHPTILSGIRENRSRTESGFIHWFLALKNYYG